MTKARTNASATPAVGRNMVINGSMNVAARLGENAFVNSIGASAGYFTVDRFKFAMGSTATAGRLKMRWFDDGPAGISNKCIKLECTTADTSIAAAEALTLFTTLEDIDCVRTGHGTASAQQITVSFYVKGNANATYVVQLLNNQHSGFIHNNRLFSVTTDWTRVEVTFQADTTSDSEFGVTNAGGFSLGWILHAGTGQTSATLASNWATGGTNRAAGGESFFDSTDNTFQLTGVQMEVGPVATEFEQEDISTTLAKCQRYCYFHSPSGASVVVQYQGSYRAFQPEFPVTMRAAPSIAVGSFSNFSAFGGTSVSPTSFYGYVAKEFNDTTSLTVANVKFESEL